MTSYQYIVLGATTGLLLGSWLCGYMFFKRLRGRHHARWIAAGQPNVTTMSQPKSDALPLAGKARWKRVAEESGDVVLQRLVLWWRVMEWLFVGVILASVAATL